MEKIKHENPGLGGRSSPGFGFEKSPGYPGFGFGQTRVANPTVLLANIFCKPVYI